MKKTKYLILGAGVSGLSFASGLGKDEDYIILEKEKQPGGYCKTTRRNGYVWDYAGHFFHFSHPELKHKFEEITKSDDTVTRVKNTKIYYKDRFIDYPFQKNIHQLNKDELIECLYDLFTKVDKENYDNFLDMLYGKFGKGITNKFLKPYNEKLYACDLNQLDVDAMGRFFPYANLEDIIRNMKETNNSSYNNTFIYPKVGASIIVEKLLSGIDEQKINYSEKVDEIDFDKRIAITNKGLYQYEYLISSIPFNELIHISNYQLDQKDHLLSYNQVLVLNLGFDKDSIDKTIHWYYIPDKSVNFYRVGFYNNIIGDDKLSLYIEIGYPQDFVVDEEEIQKQLNLTLENLRKIGIIDQHKLLDWQPILMNPAYVHITKDSITIVEKAKQYLESKGVFIVGRYGEWKYCSIEDCMVDSMKILNKITNK